MKHMIKFSACLLLVFLMWTKPSWSQGIETTLAKSFIAASSKHDVPLELLVALAVTESSLHPWAVNISSNGFYPQTKKEALELVQEAKNYDLGVMQINSWWLHPSRLDMTPSEILDPKNNIDAAAWILRQEIDRHGVSWKAIGAYHSNPINNPERSKAYALRVSKKLASIKK